MGFQGNERFEVLRHLGSGGMGSVYQVRDRQGGGVVALKTLQEKGGADLYRLKREFRGLADLRHPNLVALYELLVEEHSWYFTMEFVDGVPFQTYVCPPSLRAPLAPQDVPPSAPGPTRRGGRVPSAEDALALGNTGARGSEQVTGPGPGLGAESLESCSRVDGERLRRTFGQLCAGVMALHARKCVHRDLKPSNVLVTAAGRVVVLDFGLVSRTDGRSATGGCLAGTPAYMAPEQLRDGGLGPACDWYAVGIMLYEALTGRLPFTGAMLDVLRAKHAGPPMPPQTWNPLAAPDLSTLCLDLLQSAPEARPSGVEVLERLRPQEAAGDPTSRPPGIAEVRTEPHEGGGAGGSGAAFVGRRAERRALQGAYAEARAGGLAVVVLRGSSGIGKTALAERFLEEIEGEAPGGTAPPNLVLRGRCHERETVPYKAFDAVVDELSRALLELPERELRYVLPEDVQALAAVFPVLRRLPLLEDACCARPPVRDARELRNVAFRALRDLLVRLAGIRRLALFIDDLQWADDDSFALLRALLQEPGAPGLLLLCTCRTERESRSEALEAALREVSAHPAATLIPVGPLTHEEAAALAAALLRPGVEVDHSTPQALLRKLAEEARGIPFFVLELVHHLRTVTVGASGGLAVDDDSLRLDRLIVRRMQALPEAQQWLLRLVSVAADPLPQGVLARAASRSPAEPDWERDLAALEAGRFLRRSGYRAADIVEASHARVREAIAGSLNHAMRREEHLRLATALEQAGEERQDLLAQHWLAAGETGRAKLYVRGAARQAHRQLAFERAARLYRTALSLEPDPSAAGDEATVTLLYTELGDALAAGGRSAAAADAYLQAASRAEAERQLDLRHLAAEQLLRGGEVRRGLELVREVLGEVGLRLAPTPRRALLSVARRLAWLRLRGLHVEERPPESIPTADRRRLDVLWSVNIGLAVVDTLRSADFLLRFLQLAYRRGDLRRVAAGLGMLSGILAALGGRQLALGQRYAGEAARLSQRVDHPPTRGIAMFSMALTKYFAGDFSGAARELDAAEKYLLDHCHGVVWELATVRSFHCFSLRILGEWRELAERVDRYTADAERTGDHLTLSNLRTYQSIVWLARDDLARARQGLVGVLAPWPEGSYQVQHFFHLYARCEHHLYAAEPRLAWEALEREAAQLARSGLLRVSGLRLEHARIRGRAAVALAATLPPERRGPLLKEAARCVQGLRRGEHSASRAMGELIEAARVALSRPAPAPRPGGADAVVDPAALRALEHAIAAAEAAGTRVLAAVGRWRLGQLRGSEAGVRLQEEAGAFLREQGVRRPELIADCLAPGFPAPSRG